MLEDNDTCKKLGKNAYQSISNEYNGEKSAERLIELMLNFADGKTDFNAGKKPDLIHGRADQVYGKWTHNVKK